MSNKSTKEKIKKFAEACGMTNVIVTDDNLTGEGRTKDDWPLVWKVAELADISCGGGDSTTHSIRLNNFNKEKAYAALEKYKKEMDQLKVESLNEEQDVKKTEINNKIDAVISLLEEIRDILQ